jgi:S1-C subfamily serine protease
LRIGDLITSIDGVAVPTPAQVRRLAAARTDRPILLGIARGGAHSLLTLEP